MNRSSQSRRHGHPCQDAAEIVIVDYEPLPAVVDPEAALARGRAAAVRRARRQPCPRPSRSGRRRSVRRRRCDRARPLCQPTDGRRADGTACRGDHDRRPTDGCWSTARRRCRTCCTAADGQRARHRARRDPGRHTATSVAGSAARPASTAEHWSSLRRPAGCSARCVWVETRSENMSGAAARSRPDPVRRARLQARRHLHRLARPARRRRRRLPGHRRVPAGGHRAHDGATASTASPASQFDVAVAPPTPRPMGAFRGAGRPEAAALLERIIDQAAASSSASIRSRSAGATCSGRDVFPYTTLTGHHLRQRRLRHSRSTRSPSGAGYEELRREQAARRASGDRSLLGIGVSRLRRDHRRRRHQRVRRGAGPRGRHRPAILAGTSAHGQGHPLRSR